MECSTHKLTSLAVIAVNMMAVVGRQQQYTHHACACAHCSYSPALYKHIGCVVSSFITASTLVSQPRSGPAYPVIDGLLTEFGASFTRGYVHIGKEWFKVTVAHDFASELSLISPPIYCVLYCMHHWPFWLEKNDDTLTLHTQTRAQSFPTTPLQMSAYIRACACMQMTFFVCARDCAMQVETRCTT